MSTEPLPYLSVAEIVQKCIGRGFKDTGEKRDYIAYANLKEQHEINERLKILTKYEAIPSEKSRKEAEKAQKKAEVEKRNAEKEELRKKMKAEADEQSAKLAAEFERQAKLGKVSDITNRTSRRNLNKIAEFIGLEDPKNYDNRTALRKAISEYAKGL